MQAPKLLDRLVETLASVMNGLGLNGTRLSWRWRNYRAARREESEQDEVRFRAVTGKHKMCPSCRSLVPVNAAVCPECETAVRHVEGPGAKRLFEWMLPGVSRATAGILSANLALYALMLAVGGASAPRGGGIGALFSLGGFDMRVLARFGLGFGPWVLGGEGVPAEPWRLVTPIFIHAGLLHVLFNCMVLLQVGRQVEEWYGGSKTWVMYLFAGVCGSLSSNFVRPILFQKVPYVGASGAVFGLVGIAMVYAWRRGEMGRALTRSMLQWVAYVTLFGFVIGGMDHFAHFGGLAGGALMGLVVPSDTSRSRAWALAALAGVAICIWAFVMAGLRGMDKLPYL